ncbi:L-lactate dehydrogenase (quinone) large subunit LdhH [Geovibrio ferrireducens]|uniref:L-lactate dehydrogenase (quinone) large subunit LdhH n=1 Tax=Geovibrio ferrireducens TaxID=46201 RepID=UPI0022481E84|nr:LUD domain-containing protein [Geovibrio ferrireducens]
MSGKNGIKRSLNDKILYTNLKNFASAYKASKANAYAGLDFPAMAKEMNSLKALTRERAENLFEEFKANAEKSGATVYRAADSLDACRYIEKICREKGAGSVVKSKSMTSEEIKLNAYLEKNGIKPVETDLGEWILQLAGEHPSHMVMPAIHKSRGQVADLFNALLSAGLDRENIAAMVKTARHALRNSYFEAGAGLTGANVAVASTGTIGLVTNEGNARLSATVPPVHFVLLGYEKLVPDFRTALKVIRMLPKSATGQRISTYTTWIKGQVPSEASSTGHKEVHYIFLDNGRLAFLDHPLFAEALKCMRCGSCANVCPAYEMVGGHVFGHVYLGAIGLIMTAMFHGEEKARDILKMCIGCRACSTNCPSGIDLQKIIAELNVNMGSKFGLNPLKKFLYSNILSSGKRFRVIMKAGSILAAPLTAGGRIKKIPFAGREINFRELPSIKQKTFTDINGQRVNPSAAKGRVFFYPGCAVEYFYPQMGTALVSFLEKQGYQVDTPDKATCCGLPAIHGGDGEGGRKTISACLAQMKNPDDYKAYLVLCPSCGFAVKEDFKHYTEDKPEDFKKAGLISDKVKSLAMFIKEEGLTNIPFNKGAKVTYHTPCHQKRGLGSSAEELLTSLLGENFIPMTDSDVCCGFGGSWSVEYPGISAGILDKKTENIDKTGADTVLTDCPGCVIQIAGGLGKKGKNINVMHLSEFLK